MLRGNFRFAVVLALALAVVAGAVATSYDLPIRDPDGVGVPTYVRLPGLLLLAFLTDVLPRAAWRARSAVKQFPTALVSVVKQRWGWDHVRFALIGLSAWYLTYAAFRNLKSYVPFVNRNSWDSALSQLDRVLWLGNDPASVLHSWLGTEWAAHFFSFIYIAWIPFIPISLVMALVWSRDITGGAWYVTAVAVDWVLGVATYFAIPTVGPIYAEPAAFSGLAHTSVSDIQMNMLAQRQEVLANPTTADTLQTIAAFASLHVGILVTVCLFAHLLRMRWVVRAGAWLFLALTILATVYLGWHYFVDAIGGVVIGVAGVWIAALGTSNHVHGWPTPVSRTPARKVMLTQRTVD